MQKITARMELQNTIHQLEQKQTEQWPLLKKEFLDTCENLKPINLIKNTVSDFVSSPDLKDNLIGVTTGLTAGYIAKSVVVGTSNNPIIKIIGNLVQMGVSDMVAKNPDTIKTITDSIMKFFTKKEEPKSENN